MTAPRARVRASMSSSTSSRGRRLLLPRSRRRRCVTVVSSRRRLPRVFLRRSTLATARSPPARPPSRPMLARVRERVEQHFSDAGAVVAGAQHRREHPLRGRSDRVRHQARAQRLGFVVDAIGSSTATRSSRSRTGPSTDAIASWMLSLDDERVERAARDRIGEQPVVEPVDDQLGLVHRVAQHVELAPVDAHARTTPARGASAATCDGAPAAAPPGSRLRLRCARPCRAGGRRRCRARPRASSRTGRARGRSGARRRSPAAGSAARARPSSVREVGGREHAGRCGTRGTAWPARPRASERCGIVAPHVGGIAPGREVGHLELDLVTAAPTRTTSRPRPGRRRRRRRRAPPCGRGS